MSAAVPSIEHEAQRELEEEMFFRGQQVGFALSSYRAVRGRLPGKLEELVEKVETPKGEMRFLRPTALCDPLMPCEEGKSNWKPARPGDSVFTRFLEAYMALQAKFPERNYPPPPAELVQLAQLGAGSSRNGCRRRSARAAEHRIQLEAVIRVWSYLWCSQQKYQTNDSQLSGSSFVRSVTLLQRVLSSISVEFTILSH